MTWRSLRVLQDSSGGQVEACEKNSDNSCHTPKHEKLQIKQRKLCLMFCAGLHDRHAWNLEPIELATRRKKNATNMKLQGGTGTYRNTDYYHCAYQTLCVIHHLCALSVSTQWVKDGRRVTGVSRFGVSVRSIPHNILASNILRWSSGRSIVPPSRR